MPSRLYRAMKRISFLIGVLFMITSCAGMSVENISQSAKSAANWVGQTTKQTFETTLLKSSTGAGTKIAPDMAMFTFDSHYIKRANEQLTWCRKTTANNTVEYAWELVVQNRGEQYAFGFLYVKTRGCRQKSGSLEKFVNSYSARQYAGVWEIAAGRREPLQLGRTGDGTIQITASNPGTISITLEGEELIRRLFSFRPQTASLQIIVPEYQRYQNAVAQAVAEIPLRYSNDF